MRLDAITVKAHAVTSTRRHRAGEKKGTPTNAWAAPRGTVDQDSCRVDGRGRPLRLALTPGHKGECPQAAGLLKGLLRGLVGAVIADAAYDSDALRECVRGMGASCFIRSNPTRRNRKACDRKRDERCNVVDRFVCRLRRCRSVTTRHEQAVNFAGLVDLAAFVTAEEN